ncbi:MAG: alpha-L-fucosidase [Bacteroidales bacterium]|nr:alpha-L-fucosidase [Bacteroidales bacterium]
MKKTIFALSLSLALASCAEKKAIEPYGPLPTEDQIALQDMEMYAFIHYSLNTYTDQEWGFGNEDVNLFNPELLDVKQWVKTCKGAGMKGIIFTAKHHCGFCMWPSEFTEYSVKNAPWKDGKGDVVKELAEACREEGLRFAVYLSPWDRNHAEYGHDEYVTYFRNQLRELLTNYGDIFEVWFDGANGGDGWYGGANETRKIDRLTYYQWGGTYEMIRELQPHCIIWNDGADRRGDLRWVGTEAGNIGHRNWSKLNSTGEVEWSHLHNGVEDGDVWVPGETNTSIRPGWFYHTYEDSHVKSLSKLMDTYYKSVGRNSTLLLNFPVMPNGLISPIDSARGVAFSTMIDKIFSNDLAKGIKPKCEGDSVFTLEFKEPKTFNRFMACEDISLGQRVKKFQLEALVNNNGTEEWVSLSDELADYDDGLETIGRKRIICFPTITASKVRMTITETKAIPVITRLGVFFAPEISADIQDAGEKISSALNVAMIDTRESKYKAIMIDLETPKKVKGIRYLPPQGQNAEGIITHYVFYAMLNGQWQKLAAGEFSNIVNNPIWQTINISPVETKLIRLDAMNLNKGTRTCYDDLEVIYE